MHNERQKQRRQGLFTKKQALTAHKRSRMCVMYICIYVRVCVVLGVRVSASVAEADEMGSVTDLL